MTGAEEVPRDQGKAQWERPTLTLLGNARDLIRANGKSAEGSDPGSTSPFKNRGGIG